MTKTAVTKAETKADLMQVLVTMTVVVVTNAGGDERHR